MLTKKDLQESEARIGKRIDEAVKDGFAQFYESIFLPSLERNEKEHEMLKESIDRVGQEVYEIKDYIKDHEKRIRKVEKTLITS